MKTEQFTIVDTDDPQAAKEDCEVVFDVGLVQPDEWERTAMSLRDDQTSPFPPSSFDWPDGSRFTLPTDSQARKDTPIYSGVVRFSVENVDGECTWFMSAEDWTKFKALVDRHFAK